MQLAVFDGGFEIADVDAVIDPASLGGEWVTDLLQALLEKSLLRPLGEQRLGVLRTVHDYAGGSALWTQALGLADCFQRSAISDPPSAQSQTLQSRSFNDFDPVAVRVLDEGHVFHLALLGPLDVRHGVGVEPAHGGVKVGH